MTLGKAIVIALLSGILIGSLGEHSLGYLAAIAVPKSYFEYFSELWIALFIINILQQFIGIGVLGILVGLILGKNFPSTWLVNSIACYLGVQLYFFVRSNHNVLEQPWWTIVPLMVLPLCIFLSNYIMAHRSIGVTNT